MMLLLYRLIFILAMIIGSPFLFIKAIWGQHGISERLGFIPQRSSNGRLFWFHAASVGELKILATVIPEIKKLAPKLEIAISTTTATGKRRALELFPDALVFHQPLEINSAILRTIENLKPEKLILVETEIWPLLISTSADLGIEVDLINARLSLRSFRIYKWFRPFIKKITFRFSHILAQTEADRARFIYLGAVNPEVVGNVKFDQVLNNGNAKGPSLKLKNPNQLIFVAGSIRKGEDRVFADLIARSLEQNLPVFYVLAPRHMKDLDDLGYLLESRGIDYALWTANKGKTPYPVPVLLLDTMGELTHFYGLADLTFVGGSLIPIGGHDPAEPAALGKPVLFGPYMENAHQAAMMLIESGGAEIVKDENDLMNILHNSVANRTSLIEKGRRCREAIQSMAGVSRKSARIIVGDGR